MNHNSATTESTSRIDINSPTTCPSTCTANMMTNNTPCLSDDGKDSTDEFESDDDDIVVTSVGKGESNRVGSSGNLDANDHDTILSPTGWLDCKVILRSVLFVFTIHVAKAKRLRDENKTEQMNKFVNNFMANPSEEEKKLSFLTNKARALRAYSEGSTQRVSK